MTDWQPIETAPKDGTEILGWHTKSNKYSEESGAIVVYWLALIERWFVCGVGGPDMEQDRDNITHWMPLPAPPKS